LISSLPENTNEFDVEALIKKRNLELKEDDQKATDNLKIQNILLPKKLSEYHDEEIKQEKQFLDHVKNNIDYTFHKSEISVSN
jgi:hypothetical protein